MSVVLDLVQYEKCSKDSVKTGAHEDPKSPMMSKKNQKLAFTSY